MVMFSSWEHKNLSSDFWNILFISTFLFTCVYFRIMGRKWGLKRGKKLFNMSGYVHMAVLAINNANFCSCTKSKCLCRLIQLSFFTRLAKLSIPAVICKGFWDLASSETSDYHRSDCWLSRSWRHWLTPLMRPVHRRRHLKGECQSVHGKLTGLFFLIFLILSSKFWRCLSTVSCRFLLLFSTRHMLLSRHSSHFNTWLLKQMISLSRLWPTSPANRQKNPDDTMIVRLQSHVGA